MRIKEVCKITGLTDKAVRTYINNQLINPTYTENYAGRKNYSFDDNDVDALNKIVLLRKYDFSLSDIKLLLNSDDNIIQVLEKHLKDTEKTTEAKNIVLANLKNAYDKSTSNLDELCLILNENIEPSNFDLLEQINTIWLKIKGKLPLLIVVCIVGFFVSISLLVFITIILSKVFLLLS